MKCHCGAEIPQERLEFLQETNRPITCTNCSTEQKHLVLMDQTHKTAAYAVVIPDDPESQRLAWRAFKRKR